MTACLSGGGTPLVVTDALGGWPLAQQAGGDPLRALDLLCARYGGDTVVANDRAPARHADASRGRAQRSVRTTLREYVAYVRQIASGHPLPAPPLYLNGWRAFSDHPVRVPHFH
jgi:hypothetical protein